MKKSQKFVTESALRCLGVTIRRDCWSFL